MDTLRSQPTPNGTQRSEPEILSEVLGTHSGYVRGLGHCVKLMAPVRAASTRSSSLARVPPAELISQREVQQLQVIINDIREQLQRKSEQLERQMDEQQRRVEELTRQREEQERRRMEEQARLREEQERRMEEQAKLREEQDRRMEELTRQREEQERMKIEEHARLREEQERRMDEMRVEHERRIADMFQALAARLPVDAPPPPPPSL